MKFVNRNPGVVAARSGGIPPFSCARARKNFLKKRAFVKVVNFAGPAAAAAAPAGRPVRARSGVAGAVAALGGAVAAPRCVPMNAVQAGERVADLHDQGVEVGGELVVVGTPDPAIDFVAHFITPLAVPAVGVAADASWIEAEEQQRLTRSWTGMISWAYH
jgi:hypothetical protein